MRLQLSDGGELRGLSHARWFPIALGLLVFLLTARVYAPAAHFDFVMFDDDINIYHNPHLGGLTWSRIGWAFTDSTYMHRYMPLAWLSLCAMVSVHGFDPAAYHTANIVLHAINAVLVFAMIYQVLQIVAAGNTENRKGGAAGRQLLAALAALLWSLHPLRVELVGWASGILYLEATAWAGLSAWLFLLRFRAPDRRPHPILLASSILAYAASVLTYPVAFGLPVALLAIEWWQRSRVNGAGNRHPLRASLLPVLPFLLLAVFGVVAAIHSEAAVRTYWHGLPGMDRFPLSTRLAHAAYCAWYYLVSIFSVVHLSPVGERFIDFKAIAPVFILSYVIAGIMLLVLGWSLRRHRGFGFWLLAYFGVSAPFYGIMELTFSPADRYTYVSAVVISCGLVVAITRIARGATRWALAGVLTVCVVLVGSQVPPQLVIWRNSRTLFETIVGRANLPKVKAAYLAREAAAEAREGRFDVAAKILGDVRALGEDSGVADYFDSVIATVRNVSLQAEVPPPRPRAVEAELLAVNAVREQNFVAAGAFFQHAVALDPNFAGARFNYALLLARSGQTVAALGQYSWLAAQGRIARDAERRLLAEIAAAATLHGDARLAAACQARSSMGSDVLTETARDHQ